MSKSLLRFTLIALGLGVWACGESPSGIDPELAEIVLLQGDGQFAPALQRLPELLRVVVRRTDTHEPIDDVVVEFSIVQGEGAELDSRAIVTDSEGLAETGLRLGDQLGSYRVRATLLESVANPIEFEAFAVLPPALASVPEVVMAGEVVELSGENFSLVPAHNVVLFSGVRGAVVSSTATTLSVQVPQCLLSRRATVAVHFGSVSSNQLETTVQGTDQRLELNLRENVLLQESDGSACVTLPASGEPRRYLLALQSSGRVAGARHRIGLRGRGMAEIATSGRAASRNQVSLIRSGPEPQPDVSGQWDAFLRRTEDTILRDRVRVPGPAGVEGPVSVPKAGDTRQFDVLGRGSEFAKVRSTARVVGEHVVIYVDERSGAAFTDAALQSLAGVFDDQIHEVITGVFGNESDLDGNDRVIILFTPEVNMLTDRGDDGFVAGFFFGLDLMPELDKSNGGEVFYMVVPDPSGVYSDPRTTETVLDAMPPIVAHEFQHMVHFNQRVLLGGGGGTDALWLSEGLATMAEDLMSMSGPPPPDHYLNGNLTRVARFVRDPSVVSLTVTSGSGSLAERGAGWLFVRYLWEHFGGDAVLRRLVQNTKTGVANIEEVTGESWDEIFSDWAVAVQAEFQPWGGLVIPRHSFPQLRLQHLLDERLVNNGSEPPSPLSAGDFDESVELWSGGTAYFILTVAGGQPVALNFGADGGGPLSPSSRLQLRIVRVP